MFILVIVDPVETGRYGDPLQSGDGEMVNSAEAMLIHLCKGISDRTLLS